MGRAAKVQSFFESAMTDFTEQLHWCQLCGGGGCARWCYLRDAEAEGDNKENVTTKIVVNVKIYET